MNEASRPVAVRVIRPYATEDEFLAEEFGTISKTTITLVGAHSRPEGVILRFEVTLNNGKSLVRGEGRVTGFTQKGRDGQPALTLRFTKLDPKSKALVDRAVSFRDGGAAAQKLTEGVPPAPRSSDDAVTANLGGFGVGGARESGRDLESEPDPFESATTPTTNHAIRGAGDRAPDRERDLHERGLNGPPTYDPSRAVTRTMQAVQVAQAARAPAPPTIPAPSAYGEPRRKSDLPPPLPSSLREGIGEGLRDGMSQIPGPFGSARTPLRPPSLSPPPPPVMPSGMPSNVPNASGAMTDASELSAPHTDPAPPEPASTSSTPDSRVPTTPPPPSRPSSGPGPDDKPGETTVERHVEIRGDVAVAKTAPKPVKREALLARLRARGESLSPDARARILKPRVRGVTG